MSQDPGHEEKVKEAAGPTRRKDPEEATTAEGIGGVTQAERAAEAMKETSQYNMDHLTTSRKHSFHKDADLHREKKDEIADEIHAVKTLASANMTFLRSMNKGMDNKATPD